MTDRRGDRGIRIPARTVLGLASAAAAVIATGCGSPAPKATLTPSPSPAAASPTPQPADLLAGITVTPADVSAAVSSGNALTVDMLRQLELAHPSQNFVDSGLSLATALAMLNLGAEGNTQAQISAVLHSSGVTSLQQAAAWKQLDSALLSSASGDGIALDMANAVWLQQGLPVVPAFLQTLATNFEAPSSLVDFSGDPQGSANRINQWVSTATKGMIPTVVSPADLSQCLLVLADAMYFDAHWLNQFDASLTAAGPFYRPDGSQVTAQLMHSELWVLPAYVGGDVTAVELPYVGGHYAADVIMPTSQPIAQYVADMSAATLSATLQKLTPTTYVQLTLPRFSVSTTVQLASILQTLGMTDAFNSGVADFSGIDGHTDIYVGFARQLARMQVDETGTTAAAATVIGGLGGAGGSPPPVTNIVIDHPFLFVIRDLTTGTVVFTAQVTDPTAS